ncbi:MAG: glucose-6-phosphate isomerase [Puniceicoccales bacterium]|jgi:glucose-6-phosphate isomerase|nr:glucose-6-phosphate isomerase [Puniceicoccales bacterium]
MSSWQQFKQHYLPFEEEGFALDLSRVSFPDGFLEQFETKFQAAYADMDALEKGAIANPDEKRRVGHYWLRTPGLAPEAGITAEIRQTLEAIELFSEKIHNGTIKGRDGTFQNLLCIGIGGSALGPQLVAQALSQPGRDKLAVHFLDNTDPDGYDYTFAQLVGQLGRTLAIVTSKSGSTPEPRNGMLETEARYTAAGLDFGAHAVAVTGAGSQLDKQAVGKKFLARFPMWDWVGGRTSELAAVGLLPAALQGLPIRELLAGAAAMDKLTRTKNTRQNPAALLAAAWYFLTDGRGSKDMVILPYKDRLLLFARYLQQLIMESLGKSEDLAGRTVNQGISVYGNKGSTDQHAYVQQLRDGVPNFFATFIEVLRDREEGSPGEALEVEPGVTSGDYLEAFLLGTREALSEQNRPSITLTISKVSARSLGLLIALFERAVGFYASFVGINAYHQPGVEAGKKAAASFLQLQGRIIELLKSKPGQAFTAEEISQKLGLEPQTEFIFKLAEHLAANPARCVTRQSARFFHLTTYTYH